ncbi:hypothetical protein SMICM17S_05707 [Streptomyces microflavus]
MASPPVVPRYCGQPFRRKGPREAPVPRNHPARSGRRDAPARSRASPCPPRIFLRGGPVQALLLDGGLRGAGVGVERGARGGQGGARENEQERHAAQTEPGGCGELVLHVGPFDGTVGRSIAAPPEATPWGIASPLLRHGRRSRPVRTGNAAEDRVQSPRCDRLRRGPYGKVPGGHGEGVGEPGEITDAPGAAADKGGAPVPALRVGGRAATWRRPRACARTTASSMAWQPPWPCWASSRGRRHRAGPPGRSRSGQGRGQFVRKVVVEYVDGFGVQRVEPVQQRGYRSCHAPKRRVSSAWWSAGFVPGPVAAVASR